jgi:hypothetical protein
MVIEHTAFPGRSKLRGNAMRQRGYCRAKILGVASTMALAVLTTGVVASAADPPPLERVQTIDLKGPVGGLDHLSVDARRGRLFVANTSGNSLDIVDLKAGKLLKQVPGQAESGGLPTPRRPTASSSATAPEGSAIPSTGRITI